MELYKLIKIKSKVKMESVTLTKAEYDNLTSKANQLDSLILKIEEVRNQSDGDLCMIGEVVCDELDLWL